MSHELPNGADRLSKLLQAILSAHESHLSCDQCVDQMDCVAEFVVAGGHPEGTMQTILNHIECCTCCKAEFDALVAILRMEQQAEQTE